MSYKGVAIFMVKDKAYLPCFGIYPSGIITHINPVYICDINENELVAYIKKVIDSGVQQLAEISAEEWKSQKKPLLEATRLKSWKELAKNSIGYGLEWVDQSIILTFSSSIKNDRQEIYTSKTLSFRIDTPIKEIVTLILADYKLH